MIKEVDLPKLKVYKVERSISLSLNFKLGEIDHFWALTGTLLVAARL